MDTYDAQHVMEVEDEGEFHREACASDRHRGIGLRGGGSLIREAIHHGAEQDPGGRVRGSGVLAGGRAGELGPSENRG